MILNKGLTEGLAAIPQLFMHLFTYTQSLQTNTPMCSAILISMQVHSKLANQRPQQCSPDKNYKKTANSNKIKREISFLKRQSKFISHNVGGKNTIKRAKTNKRQKYQ